MHQYIHQRLHTQTTFFSRQNSSTAPILDFIWSCFLFFFGQRKLTFRGWNHDRQVAAKLSLAYCMYLLKEKKSIDFNAHKTWLWSHGDTYIRISEREVQYEHAGIFFFSFRVCFSVPTVNMTFYINTSAYQFRISNCNEGIQEYKLSQLRLLFS